MVKSLYELSWKVSEEEYRNDYALSYSILSNYKNTGFHGLSSLYDKIQTSSLIFGSMVDTMLTGSREEFFDKFYISGNKDIGDKLKMIVANIINIFTSHGDTPPERLQNVCDDEILIAANECEYQTRWKDETRIKNIRENANDFYRQCIEANDKIVVTQQDYDDACACVDTLMNSDNTFELFNRSIDPWVENVGIEKLFQLKFKFEYEGIPYRCMMDLCYVDHKNKTIQIYDLKTSSHYEDEFVDSFLKWGYKNIVSR